MSISGLQKTAEKYAKRYVRLTLLSIAAAVVLTAIVGVTGTHSRVSVLSGRLSIPPVAAVFVQLFGLCFAIGLLGRLLFRVGKKLRSLVTEWIGNPLRARWARLARRTQALVFGVCCMLLSGAVSTAVVLYYDYPVPIVAAVMLCTWPVATYWAVRRRRAVRVEAGSTTVRTPYAELRQLETRTIALLVSFVPASTVGGGLWLLGVERLSAVGVAVLVWAVSTVVVYNLYASSFETQSALTIVAAGSRDDEIVELVVRNDGYELVDLTSATITDTRMDRYHLTDPLQIPPASSVTLCLPESFAVLPTDSERSLPLDYTLNRSQPTPIIYTQSGAAFELTCASTEDDVVVEPTPSYRQSTAIGASPQSHES